MRTARVLSAEEVAAIREGIGRWVVAEVPDIALIDVRTICDSHEALRAERAQADLLLDIATKALARVSAERDALRAALKRYGRHETLCGVVMRGSDCECGLDAAREEPEQ